MVTDITLKNMDSYLPLTFTIMSKFKMDKDKDGKYYTLLLEKHNNGNEYKSKERAYDFIKKYRHTIIVDEGEIW